MPCACDAAYPDPDDSPRCAAPVTVDDLLLPRSETPEQKARKRQVFDRIASDSRQLQAELAERDDEREAAGDGPWFERRPCLITQKLRLDDVQTAMPQVPDGPDDLLAELVEMDADVDRHRVFDDDS